MALQGFCTWNGLARISGYSAAEKREWNLGPVVENVSLVAKKDRLLAFVRHQD